MLMRLVPLAAAHLVGSTLRKKLDTGAGRHIELVVGGVIPFW